MSGALVPVESGALVEVLPGVCDETCRKCIFRTSIYSWPICDYIGITGHRRGCPPGKGCTRRIVGNRGRSISQLIFLGQAAAVQAETRKRGRPPGPQPTPEELRERRKRYKAASYERIRAALGGRQAEALKAYKKDNGLTVQTMADRVGVSRVVMSKWMEERQIANWDKLAFLGIQKPEGLPEGLGRGRKTT